MNIRRISFARGLVLGLVAGLGLAQASPAAAVEDGVEIYRPTERSPSELVEVARGLLGSAGDATADDAIGVLVLRGPPRALAQALATLRSLDQPLRQYRLHTRMTHVDSLRARGLEASGWIQIGDLRVGSLSQPEVRPGIVFRSSSTADLGEFDGSIVVLEGRTAELWTGEDAIVAARDLEVDGSSIEIREKTALLPVRTGIRARPRSRPDGSVDLELVGVRRRPGAGGEIEETGAVTRVRLRANETLVIAGSAEHDGAIGHGLLGASTREVTRENWIEMRIETLR